MSIELQTKLRVKESKARNQKLLDSIKSLNFVDAVQQQLKWFLNISKTSHKSFNEIGEDDLMDSFSFFETGVKETLHEKEKASALAFEELMKGEDPTRANPKKIHKKKPAKKTRETRSNSENVKPLAQESEIDEPLQQTARVDPLSQSIMEINSFSYQSKFILHPRVKRWVVDDLDAIRNFKDYDVNEQRVLERYKNLPQPQLVHLRSRHNLSGIEKILSHSQLCEKFSFSYPAINHSNEECIGRGFVCEMIEVDGKKSTGIIYVGIGRDNNTIFHAFFEPLKDKRIVPKQLIVQMKENIDLGIDEETNWEFSQPTHFSLEKDFLVMSVGKPKVRVNFHIYPLK